MGLSIPWHTQTYFLEPFHSSRSQLWNLKDKKLLAKLPNIPVPSRSFKFEQKLFYLKQHSYIMKVERACDDTTLIFYRLSPRGMKLVLKIPCSIVGGWKYLSVTALEPEHLLALSTGLVLTFVNMLTRKVIRQKFFYNKREINMIRYVKQQRLLLIEYSRMDADVDVYFIRSNLELLEIQYKAPSWLGIWKLFRK